MSNRFAPRWLFVAVIACAFALLGCGGVGGSKSAAPQDGAEESPTAAKHGVDQAKKGAPAGGAAAPEQQPAGQANANAAIAPPIQPMIVYNATLDVIVKDLEAATPEVEKLIAGHKGYVAKSEVKGDTGTRRSATYTIRVPVAAFPALKEGLLALGTPERNVVDTQDVTEEFIDVEARIKNLKDQEAKLNELLKEKRKEEKLEDIIKVSDRIYLVRSEIERMQGRRNYLLNRVQLSTITVTLREIKDYKPAATTFSSRIGEMFRKSWEALVDFGEGLVLVMVALVPWAPLWLPALIALVWATRRLIRLARENAAAMQERERPRKPKPVATEVEPAVEAELVKPPEEPKPLA